MISKSRDGLGLDAEISAHRPANVRRQSYQAELLIASLSYVGRRSLIHWALEHKAEDSIGIAGLRLLLALSCP
jgi:hypothetical protein